MSRLLNFSQRLRVIVGLAVFLLLAQSALAADYTWNGTAWSPGNPPANGANGDRLIFDGNFNNTGFNRNGYDIVINGNYTIALGAMTYSPTGAMDIIMSPAAGSATLSMTSLTIQNNRNLSFTTNGGTLDVNISGDLDLGNSQNITVDSGVNVAVSGTITPGNGGNTIFAGSGSLSGTCTPACNCPGTSCPSGGAVLPVKLIEFRGERQGSSIGLQWATVVELNNSHFEVERSMDGTNFVNIGRIEGQGTRSGYYSYSYSDVGAPAASALYYRLKQVDYSGSFEYSPVIEVGGGSDNFWSVRPNPVTAPLEIVILTPELTSSVRHRLDILNGNGNLITTLNGDLLSITSVASALLQQQNSGLYLIRLQAADKTQTFRIVKP